jgi:hypothetical protein
MPIETELGKLPIILPVRVVNSRKSPPVPKDQVVRKDMGMSLRLYDPNNFWAAILISFAAFTALSISAESRRRP